MREFRYPYTCPDIDKNINAFKSSLEGYLSDLFSEICPPSLIYSDEAWKLKNDYVKFIADDASDYFENVRSINSDMRDDAERVIKERDEQIEELESIISELKDKIEDLEYELRNV